MSLIGLDVGTTGCKAIVFDHTGRILGQGAREYAIAFPCPGWAEQDADQVWQLAWSALREEVREAGEEDRPHRRESLAGLLWPDWPERSARTNLRNALSNLGAAIGDRDAVPPFMFVTRETIQFNRDSDCAGSTCPRSASWQKRERRQVIVWRKASPSIAAHSWRVFLSGTARPSTTGRAGYGSGWRISSRLHCRHW